MNFKGISQILVAKLLAWLSLFKHTVEERPCSTKATSTLRSMMERSVHILEMQEAQEPKASKSDYILTFKGKEESAFHICHNLEWRCTCSFVHVFMQSLTVDFVGS